MNALILTFVFFSFAKAGEQSREKISPLCQSQLVDAFHARVVKESHWGVTSFNPTLQDQLFERAGETRGARPLMVLSNEGRYTFAFILQRAFAQNSSAEIAREITAALDPAFLHPEFESELVQRIEALKKQRLKPYDRFVTSRKAAFSHRRRLQGLRGDERAAFLSRNEIHIVLLPLPR